MSSFESGLESAVCVVEGGNNCAASGAYHLTDATGGCTLVSVLAIVSRLDVMPC